MALHMSHEGAEKYARGLAQGDMRDYALAWVSYCFENAACPSRPRGLPSHGANTVRLRIGYPSEFAKRLALYGVEIEEGAPDLREAAKLGEFQVAALHAAKVLGSAEGGRWRFDTDVWSKRVGCELPNQLQAAFEVLDRFEELLDQQRAPCEESVEALRDARAGLALVLRLAKRMKGEVDES